MKENWPSNFIRGAAKVCFKMTGMDRTEFTTDKKVLFIKFNKSIAVPEFRPNLTSCLVEIYKGFPTLKKEKQFRHDFNSLFFKQ